MCAAHFDVQRSMFDVRCSKSAFTLIELLVTIVILSTGIVVILQAFQTSMVALAQSRDSMRSAALQHALLVQAELDVMGLGGNSGVTDQVLRQRYPNFEWRVDSQGDASPGCTNAPWLRHDVRVIVRHEVTGRESTSDSVLRVPVEGAVE